MKSIGELLSISKPKISIMSYQQVINKIKIALKIVSSKI